MGQNDGVKKLRQLRKEIAQIKTVSRERELGIRGATHELVSTLPAGEEKKTAKAGAKKSAKSTKAKSVKAKSGAKSGARSSAKKSVKKGPRSAAKKSAKKTAAASATKKGAGK
jgi:large subunit ribosomal protein L29